MENLELAHSKARRGKTLKPYVVEFEKNLKENLMQLRSELLLQSYRPEPLKTFILRDPKTRRISKSAFRDRVIHHAVCNVIEPLFEKSFIHDSYANRFGKGTLKAIERFDEFKRRVSRNNTMRCFVLKADVKHYFETVRHDILLSLLKRKITDEKVLWLIKEILDNHDSSCHGRGMPLGNLTSQFFANVYLNELDQFVKHDLEVKYYIRYVDDFVIFSRSSKDLENYKLMIDDFLHQRLDLELHPDKSRILKLDKGVGFLGFRIFYHHKLLQRKNMRKFQNKIRKMKLLYENDGLEREEVIDCFEGWLAHANYANTYKYRRKITAEFNTWFPATKDNTIFAVKKHENLTAKIDESKSIFTVQKTVQLFKKGYSVKQIANLRSLKEGTVWAHIVNAIEFHQLQLKEVVSNKKIKMILDNIKSPTDTLKQVKERIFDEQITYDDIACVLSNIRGKHKKKSISYFISWYQKTNCMRKCYYNKKQRLDCRVRFQQLTVPLHDSMFTKREFLEFFNDHVHVCVLPEAEKKKYISWRDFQKQKHMKTR